MHLEHKKRHLTYSFRSKVAAFVMVILSAVAFVLSVYGLIYMVAKGFYTMDKEGYKQQRMQNVIVSDLYGVMNYMPDHKEFDTLIKDYLKQTDIAVMKVSFREEEWTYQFREPNEKESYTSQWVYEEMSDDTFTMYYIGEYIYPDEAITLEKTEDHNIARVQVFLAKDFTVTGRLYYEAKIIDAFWRMKYIIFVLIPLFFVMTLGFFIFLLKSAGRRENEEGVVAGWHIRIPFDGLTAVIFSLALLCLLGYYDMDESMLWICLLCLIPLGLYWCINLSVRLKTGRLWENSLFLRCAKPIGHFIQSFWQRLKYILKEIPFVWKTALFMIVLAVFELLVILTCAYDPEIQVMIGCLKFLILTPLVLYVAIGLRKLQRGGEMLAAGQLDYLVDTNKLLGDFKAHGENLNRIAEGMTVAVEQRLKSERMKTELITNVSHDIKTPLTSIINYADLLQKEPCDNPKITEYIEVIDRQSERLKRLIEDLVEASKAATGNLEINFAPCEISVMLTQTAGEYEAKLKEHGLTLLIKQPDQAVHIMADGRRLWRVFDNLMNNIDKYAQRGTRVYLTLEVINHQAVISFKNISNAPLDISADELMERFVQGDTSRNIEGNGLGLSIAKSLVELQKGELELLVDGDLFKVILKFPML